MALALAALPTAGLAQAQPAAPDVETLREDAAPLSPSELSASSGGQGVTVDVLTRQQLTGTTSGNSVTAGVVTSGDVTFGASALDGFNGVGNFVVNTGANNTLQGAINISIVTAAPN